MKKTGIFYHPSYSRRSYLTVGRRLAQFPEAIREILEEPNVRFFEAEPVSHQLLMKVHTEDMIRNVGLDPLCSTAWHSAGGVVKAVEEVITGKLDSAFVFIGAGGHHSGPDYFWGYCCFNDVVLAIVNSREKLNLGRVAVLDTDAHHGDGTRFLLENDPDTLHICFCDENYVSADGTKVDVRVSFPWRVNRDEHYVNLVRAEFLSRVLEFRPELIVWYFGFDTHRGDYGSIGLTARSYPEIADLVLEAAELTCGRLCVVLGGGSRTDLATAIIPQVIRRLVDWGKTDREEPGEDL